MIKESFKYYAAPMFFFLMLVDAHLTRTFASWSHGNYIWSTHLLLLLMFFAVPRLSQRYMIVSALVIGSIFDLYYIGVLGIYAVAFPLVVWLMYLLEETLYKNLLTENFGWIILVTSIELITLVIQLLFKLTAVNVVYFAAHFLGPTLLVNLVLFAVLYYPLSKLFYQK